MMSAKDLVAPLDPELMKALLTCVDEMPPEQRSDVTGRSLGLIRYLQDNLHGDVQFARAATLTSFEFRMSALARLQERPEYRAWVVKAQKNGDPNLIHEVMVETAALEPLIERKKRHEFDHQSFLRRALERVAVEGRA
jgi:hypothetical protein